MKCIQCKTTGCGWDVCRFSGMSNAEFLRVRDVVNAYAEAMIERDQSSRHEGRPDHDMRCDGMPLEAGT